MTHDEIIEMARKSDFEIHQDNLITFDGIDCTSELIAFAKLVAEKEREAIWNILFEYAGRDDLTPENESLLKHLADLIKARGHKGAVE